MVKRKLQVLKTLQLIHLLVLITAVGIVSLLHIITHDFLDFLRIPIFLQSINPTLGFAWPASLHVYQTFLLLFIFIAATDGFGLFFYKLKIWRLISDAASFIGFLLILPVSLFFILTLTSVKNLTAQNVQTALAYFVFTFFLFFLDLITWYADEQTLIKFKKH